MKEENIGEEERLREIEFLKYEFRRSRAPRFAKEKMRNWKAFLRRFLIPGIFWLPAARSTI